MAIHETFWDKEIEILAKLLFPLVRDAAMAGVEEGIAQLGVDVGIDWNLVNRKVVEYAEKYTYQLVRGITETTRNFFQEKFSEWINSGKPLRDLIDELTPLFGEVRAEMIAITETTRLFQEGNLLAWLESGVVSGFIYQTSEDELVCPICSPNANMEYALDDMEHSPPLHVRCRCWSKPRVNITESNAQGFSPDNVRDGFQFQFQAAEELCSHD